MISVYQGNSHSLHMIHPAIEPVCLTGAAIMIMSLVLFENEFLHIVAISFTALILNELIMVALEITTWYFPLSLKRTFISSRHSTLGIYIW